MAVDDVRQGIMLANEKGREALAAIQQASQTVEEAQHALAGVHGTTQHGTPFTRTYKGQA